MNIFLCATSSICLFSELFAGATTRSNGAPPSMVNGNANLTTTVEGQVASATPTPAYAASATSATSLSTVTSAFGAVSLSNGNVVAPPATTAPSLPTLDVASTVVAPTTPTTNTTTSG